MTERQALVKAMLAEPDDDLPRLVFADWLDENGDPDRAAFTRLQVEAERLTGDDRERLLGEAAVILDRCYNDWLGPVNPFVFHDLPREAPGVELLRRQPFRRGMIIQLAIREDEFIRPEVQEQLAAWAADNGIGQLVVTRDPSVRATWSKVGTMAGILVNALRGKYADGERPVMQPAASPVLASVAAVSLTGSTADDQGLRLLADSPHVGLLSALTLDDAAGTDVGLDALARSQHLPNLRDLWLHGSQRVRFTAEGVLKVVASGRLPKLTSLGLTGSLFQRFDLARVLHHPAAGRLMTLRLGVEDAFQVIGQSRHLTRLESLALTGRQVVLTSEGIANLLANPALAALRNLSLHATFLSGIRLSEGDRSRLRDRFGDGFSVTTDE